MAREVISKELWDKLVRPTGYYEYENFMRAAEPMFKEGFLNVSSIDFGRRELAALLANMAQETHKFRIIEQLDKESYNMQNQQYPWKPDVWYYGRGPLQLRWNFNYGAFSEYHFNNKDILLDNPNLVTQSGELGFHSAIWYWMTQPSPTRSAHSVMYPQLSSGEKWGFGHTVAVMKGSAECDAIEGGSSLKDRRLTSRIRYYRMFAKALGVPIGFAGEQLDTVGLW